MEVRKRQNHKTPEPFEGNKNEEHHKSIEIQDDSIQRYSTHIICQMHSKFDQKHWYPYVIVGTKLRNNC